MAEKVIGFKITVKGTEETINKLSDVELELKKLSDQIKAADKAGDKDTYKKLRIDQENLRAESVRLRAEIKEQQKAFEATKFAEGSYRALDAQLAALRKRYKEISDAERDGAIGKQILADTQRLDRQLKQIDASIGQFQRNVGNYAGSLKGLFGQLKSSIQTSGLIGRGGIGAFVNQITAAVESVTKALDDFAMATNAGYVVQKRATAAATEAIGEYVSQRVVLDTLAKAALDASKAQEGDVKQTNRKNNAIQALRKQYPDFLKGLDAEKATTEQIAKAYDDANKKLFENLKRKTVAKLLEEQLVDAVKAGIEAENARKQATISSGDLLIDLVKTSSAAFKEAQANTSAAAAGNIDGFNKVVEDVFNRAAKALPALTAAIGDEGELLKDSQEEAAAKAKEIQEKAVEQAKQAREKLIDLQKKYNEQSASLQEENANELERQRIEALRTEIEQQIETERLRLREFEKAQRDRIAQFENNAKEELDKIKKDGGATVEQIKQQEANIAQERIKIEQETQKVIQNEIVLSNEKIAQINKEFAEKQAAARLQIQQDAIRAALEQQESGLSQTEQQAQSIKLSFDFDEKQSEAAFSKAKAELDLQLAQGNISQQEFDEQLAQLNVQRLEREAEIANRRVAVEQETNAEILAQTQSLNNARLQIAIAEIEAEKNARLASLEDEQRQGIISQEELAEARIQTEDAANKKIQAAKTSTEQQNQILQQEFNLQTVQGSQATADAQVAIEQAKAEHMDVIREQQVAKAVETANFIGESFNKVADLINQFADAAAEKRLQKINEQYDREAKLAFGNAIKLQKIEEEREQEIEKLQKKNAARQKGIAITQAVINGALAVTNILATVPKFDFGVSTAVLIGLAVATTAAQVATIAAQKLGRGGVLFEDGGDLGEGVVSGPSHAEGGIKIATPEGVKEIEGGEWVGDDEFGNKVVINKRSTRNYMNTLQKTRGQRFAGKRKLLSNINSAGGGVKFASGGQLFSKPLAAPFVSTSNNSSQALIELQKQNQILQDQNTKMSEVAEEMRGMIMRFTVVADTKEIVEEGNKKIIKVKSNEL